MSLSIKQSLATPIALGAVLLLASTASLARTINETFSVLPGGELYLQTASGSIDVETHNSDEILVDVQISGNSADEFDVTFDHNASDLKVIGEFDGGFQYGWGRSIRVEYTIRVPEQYNVNLNTSGGSISVEDLRGNIEADTSGGSINIGRVIGNVDVRTSGGSIRTEQIEGQIDANTSGGSIHVEFAKQLTADAGLFTSGGSITAYLPDDIAIDIDASTSGGSVKSDFDVDGVTKKRRISGKINGGGPELTLRTSGGTVRIKSN
ncbi:DUF4097 family beta strand repeat-containing protein [Aestuariibacter salexigens]|uniref:DUF4097 family beta strand repeat-containing protein n=1 Tax=Aestuariibacter salexigens TaxID=226010 RepID=UPI0003FE9472|nr:DUF4097 family beta strand repeat-containing protein [Aestuariibacter salexigens]